MKKVLIVSPHFPPTNAADHQRVRMVLPYLAKYHWRAEVLAVEPSGVAASVDPWLSAGLPADLPIHRVRPLSLGWSRIPGFGMLPVRARPALGRKGDALLGSGRFDLVYFSTTQFGVCLLGPRWLKKTGVPYIMDYQDPWVNDYYQTHPQIIPPGGKLKYNLAARLHLRQEPQALRHCAGITSVSPDYPRQLKKRYSFLPKDWPVEILPFPGDPHDLARVASDGTRQSIFDPTDGLTHWVYVGRGSGDMHHALRGIFQAVQDYGHLNPQFLGTLRMHFVGTSYAGAGRGKKTIKPLASEYGLGQIVEEHTDRIPYAEALRCLLDASALIVPGSDDPSYTASKIYPYLLARKPLLAVFHENSSVVELMHKVRGGIVVGFKSNESFEQIASEIHKNWFAPEKFAMITELDELLFVPHTAHAQAQQLAAFFEKCLSKAEPNL